MVEKKKKIITDKQKLKAAGIEILKLKKQCQVLMKWKRKAEPVLHYNSRQLGEDNIGDHLRMFDFYWKDLVTNEDGSWNFDQVKKELHDYAICLDEVPKVYMHVTGGMLSKPNTCAFYVIDAFDRSVDDDIQEEMDVLREKIKRRDQVFSKLAALTMDNEDTDGKSNPCIDKSTVLRLIREFIPSDEAVDIEVRNAAAK
ncbi:MAG: hypothetical protein GY841_15615 [FCB group bacterium]|nr:hypothetical protein [FCB group bacterium]